MKESRHNGKEPSLIKKLKIFSFLPESNHISIQKTEIHAFWKQQRKESTKTNSSLRYTMTVLCLRTQPAPIVKPKPQPNFIHRRQKVQTNVPETSGPTYNNYHQKKTLGLPNAWRPQQLFKHCDLPPLDILQSPPDHLYHHFFIGWQHLLSHPQHSIGTINDRLPVKKLKNMKSKDWHH